jgi:hypothetical protein
MLTPWVSIVSKHRFLFIKFAPMLQEFITGLIALGAITYLLYRFFPSVFGIKKTAEGCDKCHPAEMNKKKN